MPESSYELSLRDIIDYQQNLEEEAQEELMIMERDSVPNAKVVVKKNTNSSTRVQSSQSGSNSMNIRVFLLKIFIPVPLGFKAKGGNKRSSSRITSRSSFDGSEKPMAKVRYTMKMAFSKKRDSKKCESLNKSINSNRTSKSRASRPT
nr:uncharacterized protein LOC113699648 [Coffea arabica]